MSGGIELLAFAGVIVLGQFSPGPDMILLTRSSLRGGARVGVAMAMGIACGLAVHAAVAVVGLAWVFERFPGIRDGMRWAAALYLFWLARGLLRGLLAHAVDQAAPIDEVSGRSPFLRGLFCNLLNPKAAFFLAAVTAPFLRGERPNWWPLAIWAIVVGQGGLLWSLWAYLLQWPPLRLRYQTSERWIDAAFGIVLLGLAFRLGFGS